MGISPSASRVAWYRFRCTLRARWTGYLALTLLLGLIGGLGIGSVAAARRTQGAYPAYLAATNPSLPGSVDGEYFTTDRVTVVQGRLPDPSRPDEIAMDAKGPPAPVHVGSVAELGFYTNGGDCSLSRSSCLLTVALAGRQAWRLGAAQAGRARPGLGASVAQATRAVGLPVAAGEGIRLALDPGAEPDAVPLRSVILGTGLAAHPRRHGERAQ